MHRVLLAFLPLALLLPVAAADTGWPNFGNDTGAGRFSALKQIRRENVDRLQVAWEYHTRDSDGERPIQCTPIVVDGVMYLSTVQASVAALDPATGRELWRFNTAVDPKRSGHRMANRGVAYWSDGKPKGERRILIGTPDGRLVSVDARTGVPDPAYGPRGIEIRDLVGEQWKNEYIGFSAPPMVYRDLVFLGPATGETYGSTPGDIFAFYVRTGKPAWRFHVIPDKGEPGSETWENGGREISGGAGPWNGFSLDEHRGILFAATGSATGDFYGGKRLGANLFANCLLALDARTGRRLWHFQSVHHDLWDWDNASQPLLCTARRNGKNVDAVALLTKRGLLFLFERATGKPLFDIREAPALPSTIQGERAWPTQPEPVLPAPYAPQVITEADVSDITPETRAFMLAKLRRLRFGKRYEPPTPEGTVAAPGYFGGSPWSGGSFDPRRQVAFFNVNNEPSIIEMNRDGTGGFTYQWFRDEKGYPGVRPPWGKLVAVDLNSGEYLWSSVLGEFPELTAQGIPPTGTPNMGGTLVTAGDLVFVAATKDARIRAFDSRTGRVLWQHGLPAPGYAAPCTYEVGGRQYVVVAAGGGAFYGSRTSDTYVAFALPRAGEKPATAVQLFDGKSLAGWEGDPGTWRVEDGAIVGGSRERRVPRNEFLCTTRAYRNFHLRLQYQLDGTEGFVNAGVQVRSRRITRPPNEVSGYQADIGADCTGDLYDESRRNRYLLRARPGLVPPLLRPDWNDLEIRCEGRRLRLWVNDVQTVDYAEWEPDIPDEGVIALQVHGGAKAVARYRRITVRELP